MPDTFGESNGAIKLNNAFIDGINDQFEDPLLLPRNQFVGGQRYDPYDHFLKLNSFFCVTPLIVR